ncbi:MAG: hypothetical protein EDM05_002930 [Leptolyngbya sp. IPPAS B-1204]|uniref:Uncharacterized protein n=1 Tax=Leptolyngbya sp. NK1-12 TaxID=2547451 RepID=A0AA96WP30_9CYAN|nr:hypothetical protein [Leptolyngbya sp. NK1-12]MBF2046656.1 hypothetical protein [Elainella sp. C42_A2020_010]RNJ67072.1 MAG: hypothetical protein EDM05_22330 [Leptolyngbya sp. IPPAS B-1204]WNZ25676.1 hypothetical protein HJG54_24450 [Leptolyngbya sp. NK1-12]
MTKFPWLSLALLFAAHSTFSWFLIHATAPRIVWILVFSFTLIQALLLTTLFDGFRRLLRAWLRSDTGYFTLIVVGALGITVALVWFRTFGYFLVLVSAEVLARLDLQNAGFNRLQSLFLLALFSLAGLATGWAAYQNPIFRFTT